MKETHYKLKHRVTALFAAAVMLYSMLPGAAFAEEPTPQPTEETVQMEQQAEPSETDNGQTDASSPDLGAATEESAAPTTDEPAEENEPYTFDGEVLYQDMPDAPTGSYLGSYGLPVATGETKIGLGAWDADLEQDSYLSAEALDSDNLTLATPLLEDTDYAIVPILAQVEYPTDGSTVDLVLPDSVTLLDYYGEPAKDAESLLHTIKVKISKVDITTNEELPGAELVIKDKDGTEIDRWISTNGPHYVEKMPAGDYTLTEITAPNGYKVAESIDFTVLPTGEMQTVVMKDAREDTPTPTPDNTPTPDHTPQPTPNTTPAPTPVPAAPTATPTPLLTIPKTGDNSSLGLLLAIAGISLAGLAVLVHKSARRKDIAPRDDDDEDTED